MIIFIKFVNFWILYSLNLSLLTQPTRNLVLMRLLIPFQSRLSFKQYMKDKPTKRGIKVFVMPEMVLYIACRYIRVIMLKLLTIVIYVIVWCLTCLMVWSIKIFMVIWIIITVVLIFFLHWRIKGLVHVVLPGPPSADSANLECLNLSLGHFPQHGRTRARSVECSRHSWRHDE